MKIVSSAFDPQGTIPPTYTEHGSNLSPPLTFHAVPAAAASLAVLVEQYGEQERPYTRWIVFNLEPTIQGLKQACHVGPAREGCNDAGAVGYGGPPPGLGGHRYVFRLYALDAKLALPNGVGRAAFERALGGHVLAQAELCAYSGARRFEQV